MRRLQRNRAVQGALTGAVVIGMTVPLAAPALADNHLLGRFEIDGNFFTDDPPPAIDWASVDYDHFVDPLGADDETIFSQGVSETDPVEDWQADSSATAANGSDIHNVFVYDEVFDGDQYAYIAWTRDANQGTVLWWVELNQEPNVTNQHGMSTPNRTEGDIRINLRHQGGPGTLTITEFAQWNGSAWVETTVTGAAGATNDGNIDGPDGVIGRGLFVEFGFNITEIFGDNGDCLFTGFSHLNLRSSAGGSAESALKDFFETPIDIPARCGELIIEKVDEEGNLIGPVTFEIDPNPLPGATESPLVIVDNDDSDADDTVGRIVLDAVEPGVQYTITETVPPPGYIQTTAPQDVTIEEFGSATVIFENRLGTVEWEKRDATSDELICCATFVVEGTGGAADGVSIEVTDNEAPDVNPADGVIKLEGLVTGTYTISETVAPTGYEIPADATREFEISAETADVTITAAFEDPRLLSELTVLKLDADTEESLAGAQFDLVFDSNENGQYDPGEDTVVGSCTTTAPSGTCTISDLGWGTYFWVETQAPQGYDLPAVTVSGAIVINRDNAGGEFTTTEFRDPQIRSEIEIVKRDATTGALLGGATFEIREGSASGPVVATVVTDGSGSVTVGGLLFGQYWVVETEPPQGYLLPDPNVQGPFTFGPDNAGDTITVTFDDPQILTDLSVMKVDEVDDEPLTGATFVLWLDDGDGVPSAGDTVAGECTTGESGTCTVTGLNFGDYYWEETVPPTGYDLPDDPFSVIVTINAANAGSELEPIVFHDPRRPGTLTVLKVDDSDGAPLAGAIFDLVRDANDNGQYDEGVDEVVGSCTTNDLGTCSVGELDFGTYFWVEVQAPQGYDLPDNPVSGPQVINASNVDDVRTPIEFHDPRLPSELTVRKVDAVDGSSLAGAEFDLVFDTNDNGVYDDGVDEVVDSCTTGSDGTCSIDGLDFGTYFWVETSAPTGYQLPDNPVSGPIVIDASVAGTELTAITFEDPRILTDLPVRKVDEVDGAPLAGAVFELYLDDGDGVADVDQDTLVGTCISGGDGQCTATDLDFGTYFWVEVTAPTGYDLPESPVSDLITITAQNAGTEFAAVTFEDPRKLSKLAVLKLAEDTEDPLAGAVFELYLDDGDGVPSDDDTLVGECTTEENGLCAIGGLDFGDYYWVETVAPEGYLLPDDVTSGVISITAANAGTTFEVTVFVDPPVPPEPVPPAPPAPKPPLPVTGTSLALIGLAVALLVAGGVMLAMHRRGRLATRGAYRA